MRLILFSIFATIFGFAPTGLLALSYSIAAWANRSQTGDSRPSPAARRALRWCWITVAIGVAVEVPVVTTIALAALSHSH
jgi:Interferon-induced transmembrane protein